MHNKAACHKKNHIDDSRENPSDGKMELQKSGRKYNHHRRVDYNGHRRAHFQYLLLIIKNQQQRRHKIVVRQAYITCTFTRSSYRSRNRAEHRRNAGIDIFCPAPQLFLKNFGYDGGHACQQKNALTHSSV